MPKTSALLVKLGTTYLQVGLTPGQMCQIFSGGSPALVRFSASDFSTAKSTNTSHLYGRTISLRLGKCLSHRNFCMAFKFQDEIREYIIMHRINKMLKKIVKIWHLSHINIGTDYIALGNAELLGIGIEWYIWPWQMEKKIITSSREYFSGFAELPGITTFPFHPS